MSKICVKYATEEWHLTGSELVGLFVSLVFNYFSLSAILTFAVATRATLTDTKS